MTTPINMALYRYLTTHGLTASEAEEAARLDASDLVTKADLQVAIAELKADLFKHTTQTLVWTTGIYGALITIVVMLARVF